MKRDEEPDLDAHLERVLHNLERDSEFEAFQGHHGQGAWNVARRRYLEAENLEGFEKLELIYWGDGRNRKRMIYAIGHRVLEYGTGPSSKRALFYLEKPVLERGQREEKNVRVIVFEDIKEFTFVK